jgi:hypothetical protein
LLNKVRGNINIHNITAEWTLKYFNEARAMNGNSTEKASATFTDYMLIRRPVHHEIQ